jgi:hypothetical protein
MLYTILLDDNKFLDPQIDSDQIDQLVGELSSETRTSRIDLYHGPRSFKGVFSEPLKVNFPVFKKSKVKREIPDIAAFEGRLFLNKKAYSALKDLIEADGEFIPAVYEGGDAFIYTPLNVAENIEALDAKLSRKNEWGDLENLSFHEEKLGNWVLFRAEYNAFYTLQCTQAFVDAVLQNDLKGLYITTNLGSIFAVDRSEVSKLN